MYVWQRLFLLLFMGLIALFGTIYGSYCTISANFYLQYFQQKIFSFSKINGSQTECENYCVHSIIQIIIQVFDMITPW